MTAWLLTWLWQGSAVVAVVAVVLRYARRLNAATRHVIWCGALAAVAFLGFASSPHSAVTALKGCATDIGGTGFQPCPSASAIYVPSAPEYFVSIFIGFWAAITLVNLIRLVPALHRVYALRDRCTPFPENVEAQLPLWLEAKYRGRRTDLLVCDGVPGATVLGFQRPCIAIPSALIEALTSDELDQVILHEHGHVQRRDDWTRLAETLLLSAVWIHPAAAFIARALHREREVACDEWVVARTGHAKRYARCLARAAELRGHMRDGSTLVPALLGRRHELIHRVDRLLAMRGAARRNISLAGAAVAACAIAVTSAHVHGVRFAEIPEVVFPHVSAVNVSTGAPRVGIFDGLSLVLAGPDPRSLSLGGFAPRSGRTRFAPAEPDAPLASTIAVTATEDRPNASTSAPTSHIATVDKPDAPTLSARSFQAAYAPIAPNGSWRAFAVSGIEIASAAKKTSVGVATVFSRAGVSLARSF